MAAPDTRLTLIQRISDPADQQAWEEFVFIYTPVVYNFCLARGLQISDAEDMTQDVMHSVSRSIGRFQYRPGEAKFRSWLYQISRNRIFSFLNIQRRKPLTGILDEADAHPDAKSEEAKWEQNYREQLFRWATGVVEPEFNPRIWQAFWRSAVEEDEPSQISESLGMSRAAIYMAKSRCIQRLREKIESTGEAWEALAYDQSTSTL